MRREESRHAPYPHSGCSPFIIHPSSFILCVTLPWRDARYRVRLRARHPPTGDRPSSGRIRSVSRRPSPTPHLPFHFWPLSPIWSTISTWALTLSGGSLSVLPGIWTNTSPATMEPMAVLFRLRDNEIQEILHGPVDAFHRRKHPNPVHKYLKW